MAFQGNFVSTKTNLGIMAGAILLEMVGASTFLVLLNVLELPLVDAGSFFCLWVCTELTVLVPLTYYWTNEEMRTKVWKVAKKKFLRQNNSVDVIELHAVVT